MHASSARRQRTARPHSSNRARKDNRDADSTEEHARATVPSNGTSSDRKTSTRHDEESMNDDTDGGGGSRANNDHANSKDKHGTQRSENKEHDSNSNTCSIADTLLQKQTHTKSQRHESRALRSTQRSSSPVAPPPTSDESVATAAREGGAARHILRQRRFHSLHEELRFLRDDFVATRRACAIQRHEVQRLRYELHLRVIELDELKEQKHHDDYDDDDNDNGHGSDRKREKCNGSNDADFASNGSVSQPRSIAHNATRASTGGAIAESSSRKKKRLSVTIPLPSTALWLNYAAAQAASAARRRSAQADPSQNAGMAESSSVRVTHGAHGRSANDFHTAELIQELRRNLARRDTALEQLRQEAQRSTHECGEAQASLARLTEELSRAQSQLTALRQSEERNVVELTQLRMRNERLELLCGHGALANTTDMAATQTQPNSSTVDMRISRDGSSKSYMYNGDGNDTAAADDVRAVKLAGGMGIKDGVNTEMHQECDAHSVVNSTQAITSLPDRLPKNGKAAAEDQPPRCNVQLLHEQPQSYRARWRAAEEELNQLGTQSPAPPKLDENAKRATGHASTETNVVATATSVPSTALVRRESSADRAAHANELSWLQRQLRREQDRVAFATEQHTHALTALQQQHQSERTALQTQLHTLTDQLSQERRQRESLTFQLQRTHDQEVLTEVLQSAHTTTKTRCAELQAELSEVRQRLVVVESSAAQAEEIQEQCERSMDTLRRQYDAEVRCNAELQLSNALLRGKLGAQEGQRAMDSVRHRSVALKNEASITNTRRDSNNASKDDKNDSPCNKDADGMDRIRGVKDAIDSALENQDVYGNTTGQANELGPLKATSSASLPHMSEFAGIEDEGAMLATWRSERKGYAALMDLNASLRAQLCNVTAQLQLQQDKKHEPVLREGSGHEQQGKEPASSPLSALGANSPRSHSRYQEVNHEVTTCDKENVMASVTSSDMPVGHDALGRTCDLTCENAHGGVFVCSDKMDTNNNDSKSGRHRDSNGTRQNARCTLAQVSPAHAAPAQPQSRETQTEGGEAVVSMRPAAQARLRARWREMRVEHRELFHDNRLLASGMTQCCAALERTTSASSSAATKRSPPCGAELCSSSSSFSRLRRRLQQALNYTASESNASLPCNGNTSRGSSPCPYPKPITEKNKSSSSSSSPNRARKTENVTKVLARHTESCAVEESMADVPATRVHRLQKLIKDYKKQVYVLNAALVAARREIREYELLLVEMDEKGTVRRWLEQQRRYNAADSTKEARRVPGSGSAAAIRIQ